ncbi:uncharacterized protein KY384_003448 [Bacidia gigantensis]|uniref:uncharacterized protein n=1 Tax=Bacidia gigantensis TaxID=2732470 RepID=UPI001D0396C4|nr:uncharacterized protein KY384_003448 [Bacidia gigantensis]KAG8531812.1 hypothetical protein KY384_003448 [Bacidia gigantensis]
MASGIEGAASIAGLISLGITVFQGCVQGFVLLSTARQIGKDGDFLRCMIEWEHYRLFEWAQQVGIIDGEANRNLDWTLLCDLLQQLQSKLTDTELLKKRYGLQLTQDELTDSFVEAFDGEAGYGGLRSLTPHISGKFLLYSSNLIREKSKRSPVKCLRWAMVDKDNLKSLLDDVKSITGCLWDALVIDDRRYIRDSLDRLLRSSIAQSESIHGLDTIKELASHDDPSIVSAGQLRQAKLDIENSTPSTQGALKSKSRSAKVKALRLKQSLLNDQIADGRRIVTYGNQYYLAENKNLIGNPAEKQKSLYRAENIAILLHETVSESFHTLKCKGFLKNDSAGVLHFLYEFPQLNVLNQGQLALEIPDIPVYDLTGFMTSIIITIPDIRFRLLWCTSIAETLLQLHTAGWVHKGVSPESIIWTHTTDPTKLSTSQDFDDNAQREWMSTIYGPYLMGFSFARKNSPSEFSEAPSASGARARAYRHFDIIGQTRPSFHAKYDVYALGMILVEIGLWSPIEMILQVDLDDIPQIMSQESTLEILETKLASTLPRKFVTSVMMALRYKGQQEKALEKDAVLIGGDEQDDDDDSDEDVKVIDIQQTIVSNLKTCLDAF